MRGPFVIWALYQHLAEVWVVARFLCGFIPRLNLTARVNFSDIYCRIIVDNLRPQHQIRAKLILVVYTQCTVKLRSLKLRFYLVVYISYAIF